MAVKGPLKWIITFTVVFATLLQMVDATVVNVAMPHMMGNLGASFDDIGWIVTTYAIGIVLVLPISGWMAERFGRKRYFIASIVVFTIASFFCGHASSLGELIFFRFIQGLAGGGMSPTAQAILIETWPTEELGMAMSMFGMGVIIGPLIGPVLGGYITQVFNWSWCFYINIPLAAIALFFISIYIPETEATGKGKPVDWWGLGFLTIAISSLQVVLERGQQENWFDTTYIIILTFLAVVFTIVFIWRELVAEHPVVDLRIFKYKSFTLGTITTMVYGLGMFGTVFISPLMFQNLLGFTPMQTGFISVPGALMTIMMMPLVGRLMKGKTPAQLISCVGVGFFALFCFMMNKTTLEYGNWSFVLPIMIRGFGLSMVFIPITTMLVQDLRGKEIAQGTGVNNMLRQLGGSIGIALITTFVARRNAFHKEILDRTVTAYNNPAIHQIKGMAGAFMQKGFDFHQAQHMAYMAVNGMTMKQSMMLTYADVFWAVGIFFICIIPLLLVQKFNPRKDDVDKENEIAEITEASAH